MFSKALLLVRHFVFEGDRKPQVAISILVPFLETRSSNKDGESSSDSGTDRDWYKCTQSSTRAGSCRVAYFWGPEQAKLKVIDTCWGALVGWVRVWFGSF